jgi:rhodanese-related sulfurtransferase
MSCNQGESAAAAAGSSGTAASSDATVAPPALAEPGAPSVPPADAAAAWPAQLAEWSAKARAEIGSPTLSAAQAAALPDDVLIVDVREPREIAVSGLARAMPLTSEASREEFVRKAAGETVLVYCTVGWRSAQYAKLLADAGVNAFNIDGGLCAWAAAGLPLQDPRHQPTKRIHAYSRDFAGCVPAGFEAVTE